MSESEKKWSQAQEEQFLWYGCPVLCSPLREAYLQSECGNPDRLPTLKQTLLGYIEAIEKRVNYCWKNPDKERLLVIAEYVYDNPPRVLIPRQKILIKTISARPICVYRKPIPYHDKLRNVKYSVFKDIRLNPYHVFEEDDLARSLGYEL